MFRRSNLSPGVSAVLSIIIGLLITAYGGYTLFTNVKEQQDEKSFMERAVEVDFLLDKKEKHYKSKTYFYDLYIEYYYNDTLYSSVLKDIVGEDAKNAVEGEIYVCYIDPENPKDCRLETIPSSMVMVYLQNGGITIVGLFMLISGIFTLTKGKKRKTLAQTSPYASNFEPYRGPDQPPVPTYGVSQDNSFGSAPTYGAPQDNSFGSAPTYGAPQDNGFGSAPTYGASQNSGFGSAPTYGAPQNNGFGSAPTYGAPQNNGFGSAPTYGAPQNNGFGSAPTYGAPQNNGFGSSPTYGAPQNNGFGSAPTYGSQQMPGSGVPQTSYSDSSSFSTNPDDYKADPSLEGLIRKN